MISSGGSTDSAEVVATWAEAAEADLAPLVVLQGLGPLVPGSGEISVNRLGTGHSNETFLVRRDGIEIVLRRPPRPPIPPTAHDVVREGKVLAALSATGVRVPKPLLVHPDPNAIGAPFYLMELVPGVVIRDRFPAAFDNPDGRRQAVSEFVDALIEIHDIEWRGTGLESIGRPNGYLGRQLRRWTAQWDHNKTRDVEQIGRIGNWLSEHQPSVEETTVVHGDAKLDNAIYRDATPARLAALVDWEMATLGDPLADLGLLCGTYVEPGETPDPVLGFSPATTAVGSPRRQEIAAWYAERSGRDIADLVWYEVLALWKIVILLEGSYKRFLAGTTSDRFFERLEDGVPRMAAALADRIAAAQSP